MLRTSNTAAQMRAQIQLLPLAGCCSDSSELRCSNGTLETVPKRPPMDQSSDGAATTSEPVTQLDPELQGQGPPSLRLTLPPRLAQPIATEGTSEKPTERRKDDMHLLHEMLERGNMVLVPQTSPTRELMAEPVATAPRPTTAAVDGAPPAQATGVAPLWRASMLQRALHHERMGQVLQTVPAFEQCTGEQLHNMVASGDVIHVARYGLLFREGAPAQFLYVLLEGTLEHTSSSGEISEKNRVQTCKGDGSDGVYGVPVGQEPLTNSPRMTTAKAVTDCRLLQLSAGALGLSFLREAVMRAYVRSEIKAVPMFDGVTVETFEKMAPLMDCLEVNKVGTDIISEGSVPEHLGILAHGEVDIILKNGVCVARAKAHDKERHNSYPFFGEMGLLANKPAMAYVRAVCPGGSNP